MARGEAVSYSRWASSVWYTYWRAATDAVLSIEHVEDEVGDADLTYEQARAMLPEPNAIVRTDKIRALFPRATLEDLVELLGYIRDFIADVDHERARIAAERRGG